MSLRNGEIYVSPQTLRGLRYAALRLSNQDAKQTADSVADDVLTRWLADNHPDIVKHINDAEVADTAFRKHLTAPP